MLGSHDDGELVLDGGVELSPLFEFRVEVYGDVFVALIEELEPAELACPDVGSGGLGGGIVGGAGGSSCGTVVVVEDEGIVGVLSLVGATAEESLPPPVFVMNM